MSNEDAIARPAEPIAIIGMSCRFPDAPNPQAFWSLLREGRDAVREVPPARWSAEQFYDPDPSQPGKSVTRHGGYLPSIAEFDQQFFGISRREAQRMDPQQRMALELTWEALEDAELVPAYLTGSEVGVFFGVGFPEYGLPQFAVPRLMDSYTYSGFVPSMVANRISYFFDFRGPSFSVDTACSSSLTALHLACQSLQLDEVNLAIVGGVSLMVGPLTSIGMSRMFALSPRGRCHFLDANADGYGRGEGGGAVVLKRLSNAIADGDRIRAVVRGVAINQDGRSNGLTAPNKAAQEAVIRAALRRAGIEPGAVDYVEAHGTGTLLGDPVELHALGAVVAAKRASDHPCRVGSVKTNFGHLESAAGIAGLIKVALMLEHRELVPSLHFREPNSIVNWSMLPIRVQTTHESWPTNDRPAIAGVSSFGFGGANAHAVLTDVPATSRTLVATRPRGQFLPLLVLSAKSQAALGELKKQYWELITSNPAEASEKIHDLFRQAAIGRSHFPHRMALVATESGEMLEALSGEDRASAAIAQPREPAVAMVMPHVLPTLTVEQWNWLNSWSGFHSAWTECETAAQRPLSPLVEKSTGEMAQVTLAFGYSLERLWRSFGIAPVVTCGLGIGEIAAAVCADEMSLESALSTVSESSSEYLSPERCAIIALYEELCCLTAPTLNVVIFCGIDQKELEEFEPAHLLTRPSIIAGWTADSRLDIGFARAVGSVYMAGVNIDWPSVFTARGSHPWQLPTYPFQRTHCWLPASFPLFPTGATEAHRAQLDGEFVVEGNYAPRCEFANSMGERIALESLLEEGPLAIVWLRGRWCPYSQVILKELQHLAPSVDRLGGRLVAILPQSMSDDGDTGDRRIHKVELLEDVRLRAATDWGLSYELSSASRQSFTDQCGIRLNELHGDSQWLLPQTACYLVAPDRQIVFASVLADCTSPLPLMELLEHLRSLSFVRSKSVVPP